MSKEVFGLVENIFLGKYFPCFNEKWKLWLIFRLFDLTYHLEGNRDVRVERWRKIDFLPFSKTNACKVMIRWKTLFHPRFPFWFLVKPNNGKELENNFQENVFSQTKHPQRNAENQFHNVLQRKCWILIWIYICFYNSLSQCRLFSLACNTSCSVGPFPANLLVFFLIIKAV